MRLIPIERPIEVLAYLVDERGAPVEGQSIQLYSRRSNTTYHGTSDAQGEVSLPNVLPGFDYRLTVEPTARYRTLTWTMVDLTRARAPLEIVLESLPTGRVWGRMVDVSGYPVPHFSMWLQSDEAQGSWIKVIGDSFGYFEIGDVPEGRLRLQTLSRPLFRTTGVELVAGSDVYVEVVLDWGEQVLEGKVISEGGEPLAGARVQLDWRGDWWLVDTHQSIRQTVADSAGIFVFSGLGGGPYDLRASAPVGRRLAHPQRAESWRRLPPEPFAWLGANATMRWKEHKAGRELWGGPKPSPIPPSCRRGSSVARSGKSPVAAGSPARSWPSSRSIRRRAVP